MNNYSQLDQTSSTPFASIVEAIAAYDALLQKYQELQKSHDILKKTCEHTVNEARADRDFYMGLYTDLLNEEVAA